MTPLNCSSSAPRISPAMAQRSRSAVQRPSRSDLRYHARVAIDTLLVQSDRLKQDLESLQVRGVVWTGLDTIHRSALALLQLTQPQQGGKALDLTIDRHGITDLSQPPSKRLVHLILHTCASLLQDFGGQEFTQQVQLLQIAAQQLQVMLDLLEQNPLRPMTAALVPIAARSATHAPPRSTLDLAAASLSPAASPFGLPKTVPLALVFPDPPAADPSPTSPTAPPPNAPPSPSPELFTADDLPLKPPSVPPLQVLPTPEVTATADLYPRLPLPFSSITHTTPSTGATILVVDDSRTNREVLSQYLTQEGYQVCMAINGEQALQMADAEKHDLILLDVVMPKPDGYEVLAYLKNHTQLRHVPVIMISALDQLDSVVKGIEMGAEDYLSKPFNPVLLRARIGACLEKKRLRDQEMHYVAELKRTQTKLIQSEKMSSLGQMVAGLAHEINNPINFIYGNLKPAQDYVQDLLSIIHTYQEAYPNPTETLQELLEDLEIDFIEEDIFKLMQSMRVGAERIRDLVLSLRNFSRLDEAEMKPARVEEGLDSTLLILRHQLSEQDRYPSVEVIKEYGEIPETLCYPSQLNQVYMNLLSNAIDAMRGNEPVAKPQIHIKTFLHGEGKIRIKIADNGCGIEDEIKTRIFDPFFTTKPVGSGQGLGLSICYQIVVDKHKGRLWCRSKVGQGSEFTIEIPNCPPERDSLEA